jgi:hypothetical protein
MNCFAAWFCLMLCLVVPATVVNAQQVPSSAKEESSIAEDLADGSQGSRIIGLHRTAVATMRKTCDDYRRIKALELSVTLNIPFREAYGNINDVMPIMEPIDKDLLRRPVRLPKEIQPHKDEITKVQQQVEMMIELTEKLLLEIEQAKVVIEQHLQDMQPIKLEEIVQQEKFDPEKEAQIKQQQKQQQQARDKDMKQLVDLAKEDDARFKDISAAMRQVMQQQEAKPPQQPQTPQEQKQQQQEGDLKRQEIKAKARSVREDERKKLLELSKPTPKMGTLGRMVTQTGDPTEWLFVDTWYTIGPFPNPSRVNLNRKFPPESVVDLDAVYTGKDNRPVRWEFLQSRDLRVVPVDGEPYGIWYAYTELYFDKDMDLWIAIGSDDKANIWVNDLPVWISGDELKAWRSNEGYRKVAFKAGRNRILYRVENGWHGIMFSLAVHTAK